MIFFLIVLIAMLSFFGLSDRCYNGSPQNKTLKVIAFFTIFLPPMGTYIYLFIIPTNVVENETPSILPYLPLIWMGISLIYFRLKALKNIEIENRKQDMLTKLKGMGVEKKNHCA